MICLKWTKFIERKKAIFISGGALLSAIFTLFFAVSITPLMALLCSLLIGLCGQLKHSTANHHSNKCLKGEITNGVYIVECHCDRGIRPFIFNDGHVVRMVWDTSCFFLSASMLLLVSVIAYKNKTSFT